MKIEFALLCASVIAASVVDAGAAPDHREWLALDQPLRAPMMPSTTRKRHRHIYYGVGGGKHQTATGGPTGGITSRN